MSSSPDHFSGKMLPLVNQAKLRFEHFSILSYTLKSRFEVFSFFQCSLNLYCFITLANIFFFWRRDAKVPQHSVNEELLMLIKTPPKLPLSPSAAAAAVYIQDIHVDQPCSFFFAASRPKACINPPLPPPPPKKN